MLSAALFLLTLPAFAQEGLLPKQPPNFIDKQDRPVVFVDFKKVHHRLKIDVAKKEVTYSTEIKFESPVTGYPVFDVVENPTSVKVDGASVGSELIYSPDRATQFRIAKTKISARKHTLLIEGKIKSALFAPTGVNLGFWMTDLKDRSYLEKYLPSNLEFDPQEVEMDVEVVHAERHRIYTNGELKKPKKRLQNRFFIEFPPEFTTSSFYFHLIPESEVEEKTVAWKTGKGRSVDIQIYRLKKETIDLEAYEKEALNQLNELSMTFGPYAYSKVLLHAVLKSSMEYSGAVISYQQALKHELCHLWLGRALRPAGGNAGWIDEGLTVWRSWGYPSGPEPKAPKPLASGPIYSRTTNPNSYAHGKEFFAYLNGTVGGLKPFLRWYYEHRRNEPYDTESFIAEISKYYRRDLTPIFRSSVF
jgi:hypothetical protein